MALTFTDLEPVFDGYVIGRNDVTESPDTV